MKLSSSLPHSTGHGGSSHCGGSSMLGSISLPAAVAAASEVDGTFFT